MRLFQLFPSPYRCFALLAILVGARACTRDRWYRGSGGVTVLDLRGYTVMPGIVGMHNHLYTGVRPNLDFEEKQEGPTLSQQMIFSAPRLYLAAGVTTMRTTGSMNPYADLNLKHAIEVGTLLGPHMDVTGPFLEGAPATHIIEQHELSGPDEARQMVEYWADRGQRPSRLTCTSPGLN